MSKVLLIDGNSIGYAAHHAMKLTAGGMQTQAVFGFVKTLRELLVEYRGFKPMVLWDGRATWRYALLPEYKGERESDPVKVAEREAYVAQRPYIWKAVKALGVRQILAAKHEADDLAGYFVKQLISPQKPENEVVLITGDKDWIQLVRPGVTWRDPRDDSKTITIDNILDKTGYRDGFAFLQGKCLQGDASDDISGVGGIGEGTAPEILAEFGSITNFWKAVEEGYEPKTKALRSLAFGTSPFTKSEWLDQYTGDPDDKKAIKKHMDLWPGQGKSLYRRNFQIMQLLAVKPPEKADIQVTQEKPNVEAFRAVCEELAFNTILRTTEVFMRPFQQ